MLKLPFRHLLSALALPLCLGFANAAPDIGLSGNGVNIMDGATTASSGDHTHFGTATVPGGTVSRTFTLSNSGDADLVFSGPPSVSLSGAGASQFTVSVQPNAPGTVTSSGFETPTPAGSFQYLTGLNSGWNYTGAGVAKNGSPWFVPAAPEGVQASFLQSASNSTPSISQVVSFPGTGVYVISYSLVGRGAPYITGTVSVQIDGVTVATIPDSSISKSAWQSFSTNYTCTTAGNHTLKFTVAPIATDGATCVDNVSIVPAALAPAGSRSFQITYQPSASGTHAATVSIASNDPDENPFDFKIEGIGNQVPTDIGLSAASIAENNAANATVGTLTATDGDAGDTHTFTLVTGTGDTDNASFTINSNALRLTPSADFETKSSYSVRIRADDGHTGVIEKAFTITITNVNEAPAFSAPSSQLAYETITPVRSSNNILYSVNNSAALAAASFNRVRYRMETSVSGVLRYADVAFDAWSGLTVTALRVPTPNAPGTLQRNVTNLSVDSNYPGVVNATAQTGRLEIWDRNYATTASAGVGGSSSTYDFDDTPSVGTHGSFQVHNLSSVPKQTVLAWNDHGVATPSVGFGNRPTGEPDWTFSNASGLGTTNWKLQIFIQAVGVPSTYLFTEDVAGDLQFYGTPFADVDTATLTVTLAVADGVITGNAGTGITIGGTATARTFTGLVADLNTYFTTAGKITYLGAAHNNTGRTLTVTVADGNSSTVTQSTINFTAVNDQPTELALSNTSVADQAAPNTSIGTLTTTDADAGETFTYSLVAGSGSTDNSAFTISGNTLRINGTPDAAAQDTYAVRVRTTDAGGLYFERAFTIAVVAPEIGVEQPALTNLEDGNAAISLGVVPVGTHSERVFTIRNTGNANLTGLGITIDGDASADFSVTAAPTAPVAGPSGTTTFSIRFAPAANGYKTAVLHIASNDTDEASFDIGLTGIGGQPASALAFDGVNDYIEIAGDPDFCPANGTFTVEGWVKPLTGMPTWARLWGTENNRGDLVVKTNTLERFSFTPVIDGVIVNVVDPNNWVSGQWYHVAGVVDGHTARLFVNGLEVAKVDYTGTWTPDPGGRYIGRSISPHYFKGTIDEVRFWNYARNCDQISQARVGELTGAEPGLVAYYPFNQGAAGGANTTVSAGIDATGNGHAGTLKNFSLTQGNTTSNWTNPGGVTSGVLAPTPVFAEIDVRGNDVSLWDGDPTPSISDHTDFGSPDAPVTRTFTIVNRGNQTLRVSSIELSETHGGAFTLNLPALPADIPSLASITFEASIAAYPTNQIRGATVTIGNDDCDEGTFEFAIHSAWPIQISTADNAIGVSDPNNSGSTLEILEPSAGFIEFRASERAFSIDGGVPVAGSSGPLALAAVNGISIFGSLGNDTLNFGAFATPLPYLFTILDGADVVNFTGDIAFSPGASLNAQIMNDYQNASSVNVATDANLTVSGAGSIVIQANKNVTLAPGSSLVSEDGNVAVVANPIGSIEGNFVGIDINGGRIEATGTGTVDIRGTGGSASVGSQIGVRIRGGGKVIGATSGLLTVEGRGGASTGLSNYGVLVTGAGSVITSQGSNVQVTGIEGMGPTGIAIVGTLGGSFTTAANGGGVTLIGNSMHFDATATVSAPADGSISLLPLAGVGINLGSVSNPIGGPLSLSDAELDRISAGTLNIGDATSGAIIQSAVISRPQVGYINFCPGAAIALNAGTFNSNGGNVSFNPGGAANTVSPAAAGVDVNTTADTVTGTVSFGEGDKLAINIASGVVDTGYGQLNVAGKVDLSGARLVLSGAYVPLPNQVFVIVNNDGDDAISGNFTDLPQGALVIHKGVPLVISYAGGTGNDVTLTAINHTPAFTKGADKVHLAGVNTAQSFAAWATGINDGDAQTVQTLAFTVTQVGGTAGIFTTPPAIGSTGTLTYRPNGNAGTAIFAVTLTDSGGASSAAQTFSVTVQDDSTKPTVAVSSPLGGAKVAETVSGSISVTGSAADNKRVAGVEVKLNDGNWGAATTLVASSGLTATYTSTISPVPGLNTIAVRSTDTNGNVSDTVSRSFTYVVMRPFAVTITPANGGTVTYTPALVSGKAQIGTTYTLKATAATGYFFDFWSRSPTALSDAAAAASTLSVVMSEGLSVTANFMPTPFSAGSYNGLAKPADPGKVAIDNLGRFAGALAATGRMSASLNCAGTPISIVANFDPHTGNASGHNGTATVPATLAYDLHIDLTDDTDKITGTLSKMSSGTVTAVCVLDADRAVFSTTGLHVPDEFLKPGDNTGNGYYTVVLPARDSQTGLTTSEYPQGDGIGTLTVTPGGTITLTATLADGTAITASAPMSKNDEWPLSAFIKGSSTAAGVTIGGMVKFGTGLGRTDLSGVDLRWFRGPLDNAPYYPAGWLSGIQMDIMGARYVQLDGSELPGLGATSPSGNALLEISDGLLSSTISKSLNIGATNAVTKIPAADASYSLAITASNGSVSGTFTHPGHATIKPAIRAVIYQKGDRPGAYGFFLSPVPTGSTTPGESGGVTLSPK